jgi:hypothetical protein
MSARRGAEARELAGRTPPTAVPDAPDLTTQELVALLQDSPTVTIEVAGRGLGLSRPAAYRAAKAGQIHTLRFGRRYLVPSRWLLQALMLNEPGDCVSQGQADMQGKSGLCPPLARESEPS